MKENILRSKHTFYKTLNYMEKKGIILNPAVLIRNHFNYTNRIYLMEVENVETAKNDLINRYRGSIDIIFTFSSLKSAFLYILAHGELHHLQGDLFLEDTVTEFRTIFPCKRHEKDKERILPHSILNPQYSRDKPLPWDDKMWEIYSWLKVNFRLYNSEIGKQVGLDPVTVARRKKKMLQSLYIHYPMYAGGYDNYSMLLFVLEDPDIEGVLTLLSGLSATSYLLKGSKGTYLCFASTRRTHTLTAAMRKTMKDESLGFAHLSSRWTPILDDYEKGKIEERFFYMFPLHSK
jgi:hypothetical protein